MKVAALSCERETEADSEREKSVATHSFEHTINILNAKVNSILSFADRISW